MGYCPSCGAEVANDDSYCTGCGEALGNEGGAADEPSDNSSTTDEEWSWLDPAGPFRSPRRTLNVLNGIGLLVLAVGIGASLAGVDAPLAVLPDPLPILLAVYVVAVLLLGLPLAGLLLVTDNVLGFLRHG